MRDEVKRGVGEGGHRLYLLKGPPPSLLLPSLSLDNLCKVADEIHSLSHHRPDCQNKLAFL